MQKRSEGKRTEKKQTKFEKPWATVPDGNNLNMSRQQGYCYRFIDRRSIDIIYYTSGDVRRRRTCRKKTAGMALVVNQVID